VIKTRNHGTQFPLESFHRENGTIFSEISFIPENFQWNEPKSPVPFTSHLEFTECLGKWKTLGASTPPLALNYLVARKILSTIDTIIDNLLMIGNNQ